jgi:V/A-type H+-transporting ATPase subunit E
MLSEEDADASFVTPDMLKKISAEISAGGVNVLLSLSNERIKSAGGIIVRGKDGKIEVNNTFEQRMARFSTSLREEIVKNLFTK